MSRVVCPMCLAAFVLVFAGGASSIQADSAREVAGLKGLVKECDTRIERLQVDLRNLMKEVEDARKGNRFSSVAAFQSLIQQCRQKIAEWQALRAKTLRRIAELER